MIVAALAVAGCKQDRAAPPAPPAPPSPSMADLVPPSAHRNVEPAPVAPNPAVARMEAAARAAQDRPDPAAELRTRLGPPSFQLDGWVEWAFADDDECDTVWIERADAREVEHHRYTSADADADVDACRAVAAGDPRPRIIGSVAYAHGAFDSPAAARAWLRHSLGAPSRELSPGNDHKSVWARIVGASCFTIEVDDAEFDRVITGRGYRDFEPEYDDCKRWSEGRGG